MHQFLESSKSLKRMLSLATEFIIGLELQGRSECTLDSYTYDVHKFIEWLDAQQIKTFKRVKLAHIERYIAEHKSAGKAEASLRRYATVLQSFFEHLKGKGWVDSNPVCGLRQSKAQRKLPKVPSKEEVLAVLGQPDVTTECGLRDKAILELLYSSGLRVSELCDLQLSDLRDDTIVIESGKGDKKRIVPVTERALMWIRLYVQEWRGEQEGYLFVQRTGDRLSRRAVATTLGRYAKKAGVSELSPHKLRHACASHLIEAGANLILVKDLLGHSSVSTTQIYTQICTEEKKTLFNKFHPLADDAQKILHS